MNIKEMLASFELASDVADRTKHLLDSMCYVHFETFLRKVGYFTGTFSESINFFTIL